MVLIVLAYGFCPVVPKYFFCAWLATFEIRMLGVSIVDRTSRMHGTVIRVSI